jgi:hypothetical protein
MDDWYMKYATLPPVNDKTAELKEIRCDAWYRAAVGLAKSNDRESLEKSNEYFGNVQKTCSSRDVSSEIAKNDRAIRDANLRNSFFIGYRGDTRAAAGITLGYLRQRGIGWYIAAKASGTFMETGEVEYLIDELGQVTDKNGTVMPNNNGGLKNYELDPMSYRTNYNITLGVNKRIVYPLWAYVGVGLSKDAVVREIVENRFQPDQTFHYAKYSAEDKMSPLLDLGVSAKFGHKFGVVFNAGVCTVFSSPVKVCPSFGIQLGF